MRSGLPSPLRLRSIRLYSSKMCIRDSFCPVVNVIATLHPFHLSGTLQFLCHALGSFHPVSYTHLDVYKRQVLVCRFRLFPIWSKTYSFVNEISPLSGSAKSVSYTHLDVYKRQIWRNAIKIMGFCPTMLWIRMEWSDWKCLKIQLSIV